MEIIHTMEPHHTQTWDKETHSLPYITTQRDWISENFIGVNFTGPLGFEERIFEHKNKDFIGC